MPTGGRCELTDGSRWQLSAGGHAHHRHTTVILVKLTDTSLKTIQQFCKNTLYTGRDSSTQSQATIAFPLSQQDCGTMHIPTEGENVEKIAFTLSANDDIKNMQGSYQCLTNDDQGGLETLGVFNEKLQVQASEDSYKRFGQKMMTVKIENEKKSERILDDKLRKARKEMKRREDSDNKGLSTFLKDQKLPNRPHVPSSTYTSEKNGHYFNGDDRRRPQTQNNHRQKYATSVKPVKSVKPMEPEREHLKPVKSAFNKMASNNSFSPKNNGGNREIFNPKELDKRNSTNSPKLKQVPEPAPVVKQSPINEPYKESKTKSSKETYSNAKERPVFDIYKITTKEERTRCKEEFNKSYAKYMLLHDELGKVSSHFSNLESQLRNESEGSESWKEMKRLIQRQYKEKQSDEQFLKARCEFQRLHKMLAHLKKLVNDYDAMSDMLKKN